MSVVDSQSVQSQGFGLSGRHGGDSVGSSREPLRLRAPRGAHGTGRLGRRGRSVFGDGFGSGRLEIEMGLFHVFFHVCDAFVFFLIFCLDFKKGNTNMSMSISISDDVVYNRKD